ncbi:hypothetical protein MKX08_005183 [Trichoderma sp. CBMAI-0020]|nr:hypothetical protein MKX08_005183 [Trichoderma sp. CBMAI-0020]
MTREFGLTHDLLELLSFQADDLVLIEHLKGAIRTMQPAVVNGQTKDVVDEALDCQSISCLKDTMDIFDRQENLDSSLKTKKSDRHESR